MTRRLNRIARVAAVSNRGFVVVVVLWMVAMIAALLLIYVNFVVSTGNLVATVTERVQADALMRAAIELAAHQLLQSRKSEKTHGVIDTRLGTTQLQIAFRSEGARVNLNLASKEFLVGLMKGLGASPDDSSTYADRIIAWRSPSKSRSEDPESSYYASLGLNYTPRHAPFPSVDELWLVQGIPPEVIEQMAPYLTVFSNLTLVNVADAAPQVLAALPGMNPEKMQTILNQREDLSVDPRALNRQFGGDEKPPKSYRLNAAVRLEKNRVAKAEIVILLLQDSDDPYRVLSWRDE